MDYRQRLMDWRRLQRTPFHPEPAPLPVRAGQIIGKVSALGEDKVAEGVFSFITAFDMPRLTGKGKGGFLQEDRRGVDWAACIPSAGKGIQKRVPFWRPNNRAACRSATQMSTVRFQRGFIRSWTSKNP